MIDSSHAKQEVLGVDFYGRVLCSIYRLYLMTTLGFKYTDNFSRLNCATNQFGNATDNQRLLVRSGLQNVQPLQQDNLFVLPDVPVLHVNR